MTFISFRNLDIFRIKTNTFSKIEIKIKPLTIRFTRFCVNIMVLFFRMLISKVPLGIEMAQKIDIYLAMFLSRFVRIIPLIISKIIPISHIHFFFFFYLWVLLESIYYHFFWYYLWHKLQQTPFFFLGNHTIHVHGRILESNVAAGQR